MAADQGMAGQSLQLLLADFGPAAGAGDVQVRGVSLDSRQIRPGDLFLACAGARHGLEFALQAVAAGAAAIAWEPVSGIRIPAGLEQSAGIPLIAVADLGAHAGEIAARFYDHPSAALTVVAVTGTNGKTSCCHFIARALEQTAPAAVIGSLGNGLPGRLGTATHTTPDAVTLQALLDDLRAQGARYVAMEASSHGLAQGRMHGVTPRIGVFTNLSREHLDYHGDMAAYAAAKRRLFDAPGLTHAVINCDDPAGQTLITALRDRLTVIPYGLHADAAVDGMITAQAVNYTTSGLDFDLYLDAEQHPVRSSLLGEFNLYNLLATAGVLRALDFSPARIAQSLAALQTVSGRMQRFTVPGGPLVVVDYAHTPDALENALRALRRHCAKHLVCVFGCGGERDRGKRPLMGAVAERLADEVVLTDDNPRSEDGDLVLRDIVAGFDTPVAARIVRDRAQAIAETVLRAAPEDVVLVAGKGAETWQQTGDRRVPFDDRKVVAQVLRERVVIDGTRESR